MSCEWMLCSDDRACTDREQRFMSELRRCQRPRSHDSNGAAPVEYRFDNGTRLYVESKQRRRKFLLERSHCFGESRVRKHDVDRQAEFRFKTAGEAFRTRFEQVYIARHRACIGEKRAALIGQRWKMPASIEELHAKLALKIGE